MSDADKPRTQWICNYRQFNGTVPQVLWQTRQAPPDAPRSSKYRVVQRHNGCTTDEEQIGFSMGLEVLLYNSMGEPIWAPLDMCKHGDEYVIHLGRAFVQLALDFDELGHP